MKKKPIMLVVLILIPYIMVVGQNPVIPSPRESKDHQLTIPANYTEYSIVSYKNVDFLKTNPLQLETAELHPEIYISNTHRGVIIICTSESNNALMDFSKTLELHPNYYETLTRQDTIVFAPGNAKSESIDFTKASSIRHGYTNAFHYTADPRTGIYWSKGSHKDFLQNDALGKVVYDLIIVIPKVQAK